MDNRIRILQYMMGKEKVHPAELSRKLKIEFGEVMRITTTLIKEGVIETIEKDEKDEGIQSEKSD